MYDLPELQSANDQLWAAIAIRLRARGIDDVPATLTRSIDLQAVWRDPALLLGQTCGYPLLTMLESHVQLIAVPVYEAAGCEGPQHRSAIIVSAASQAGDLRQLRKGVCAVNSYDSNTGMNLLRALIAPLAQREPFFSKVTISGSHRNSIHMIAAGTADIAAIDCVTLALLQRVEPELVSTIRVLDWSAPSPGLPLITGMRTDASVVAALLSVLHEIATDAQLTSLRADLLLTGFEILPRDAYLRISSLELEAVSQGYPHLS